MSSWHSYPSIFSIGHRALAELLLDPVIVEEKVDGCLVPEATVLTADLRYLPVGLLKPGDRLLAFTDTTNAPRLCETIVTAARSIKKSCIQLTFADRVVTCSTDHPWLVRGMSNNIKQWKTAEELHVGDRLVGLPIWQPEKTYSAGWLAGIYDGEGSLVRHGNGRALTFYQKTGPELDRVCQLLNERGFAFSCSVRRREKHHKRVATVKITGGWTEIIRFLGTIRPERLLAKAKAKVWRSSPTNCLLAPELLGKKGVGVRTVIGLSTRSHTYIGEGMLCHNSQFSFGVFPVEPGTDGDECPAPELRIRSKGATMIPDAPEKMFTKAVESVRARMHLLHPGWTYRAEYLAKPKHNALAYNRVPDGHLMVFDINTGHEEYLDPVEKLREARRVGLESVPVIASGYIHAAAEFRAMLDRESALGGPKIEGVVVKNYRRFGPDKKVLMGKFVSEAFKEVHAKAWSESNPSQKDMLQRIIEELRSPQRWAKAVQHLRERGALTDSPKDIGPLIREIQADIQKECVEHVAEKLVAWAMPHVLRGAIGGFPEWFKEELLKRQFEQ